MPMSMSLGARLAAVVSAGKRSASTVTSNERLAIVRERLRRALPVAVGIKVRNVIPLSSPALNSVPDGENTKEQAPVLP